jgi:hypothetical protein
MAYSWNTVITNLVALSPLSGVTIYAAAPKFGQDFMTPALYPSFSPTISSISVERQSSTGGSAGKSFKIERYTLHFVYLHKEYTQGSSGGTPGTDNSEYENAIRQKMSDILTALDDQDVALGVEEVEPADFSVAERLIEIGGRTYFGGQLALTVTEYDQGV